MIRVAIFADIHGKFLLPFKLVDRFQKLTGHKVDLILQCGDMGAFPDKTNMDKATLRHAKNDRDELGFIDDFVDSKIEIREFLDKLNIDMLCVRGNHEDHEFLDELEQVAKKNDEAAFSIDAYKRIWVCRSGVPIIVSKNTNIESSNSRTLKSELSIADIIAQKAHNTKISTDATILSIVGVGRIGDNKGRPHLQFIQDYERQVLQKLAKSRPDFDILISHDKSSDSQRGYGAQEIEQLLDQIPFTYHFYGHTGEAYNQITAENGITSSIKIKELEFNNSGQLDKGCMIILEKSVSDISISSVPLVDIIDFHKNTWRFM